MNGVFFNLPGTVSWVWAALLFALVVFGASWKLLHESLRRDLSTWELAAPPPGRWRGWGAALLSGLFLYRAFSPFWPKRIFDVWYWPVRIGEVSALRHSAALALLGATAFAFAAWSHRRSGVGARACCGLLAGLAAGVAGAAANRCLWLAKAIAAIGLEGWSFLLILALPVVFVASTAVLILLALEDRDWSRRARLGAGLALVLLWLIPAALGEAYLKGAWDYGAGTLSELTGVPPASEARTLAVLVLAERDGSPGIQYRETLLAAGGLDASLGSLVKLRNYLDRRRLKTVHLAQGLKALRAGWKLNWEPDRWIEASTLSLGPRFPPDYKGFLSAMTAAPATVENFARLEETGKQAWPAKIARIKDAQKMFEGFSTSYARFGDLETSNAWLQRVRGLWPLYEDNIHIEPLEHNHDGVITGKIIFNGNPAAGIKVGLFLMPSTSTVLDARRHLGGSALPDREGRFEFRDLLPGRYYLALQASPVLLGGKEFEFINSPGLIRLEYESMVTDLLPVEIQRRRSG